MFEKKYTKQEIVEALVKAKKVYFKLAEEMSENGLSDDEIEKMERFAVAVGDVAFEIEHGKILK